jgi:hypothetical protein
VFSNAVKAKIGEVVQTDIPHYFGSVYDYLPREANPEALLLVIGGIFPLPFGAWIDGHFSRLLER